MIALYDPITPMIQVGLFVVGLVILVSVAFGWRGGRSESDESPKDIGDDLHDVAERIRSKRDHGE